MKSITYAGIDVSAKELVVCTQFNEKEENLNSFDNSPQGHKKLIKFLTKRGRTAQVCMEATGVYHFDLALSLHRSDRIEVSVANPRAIKNYADATLQRAKTDILDASIILDYLKRMPFKCWEAPKQNALDLQSIARRMHQLTQMSIREKNRLHAAGCKQSQLDFIEKDIELTIQHIKTRVEKLQQKAMDIIVSDDELKSKFDLITSAVGFAEKSNITMLSELMCMPKDMLLQQWVAQVWLDQSTVESGSSVNKVRRISRLGSKHLRTAMFIPALVAIKYEPQVKAFYDKLVLAGKKKKQAIIAVMRKLIRAIWGMLNSNQPWDGRKFYSNVK